MQEWAKALAPIIAAIVISWTATAGKVEDQRFQQVAQTNCERINELVVKLREVLLNIPDERGVSDNEFLETSLELLQTTDCERLTE